MGSKGTSTEPRMEIVMYLHRLIDKAERQKIIILIYLFNTNFYYTSNQIRTDANYLEDSCFNHLTILVKNIITSIILKTFLFKVPNLRKYNSNYTFINFFNKTFFNKD
jgi:hypothetical protein